MFDPAAVLAAGFLFVAGVPAHADCEVPLEPAIPDGSTAGNDDMLAGQARVKEYMALMEEYLGCLESEEKAMLEPATPLTKDEAAEIKANSTRSHNAAVDQMEAVAARFNEQIRAYKKAN